MPSTIPRRTMRMLREKSRVFLESLVDEKIMRKRMGTSIEESGRLMRTNVKQGSTARI